MHRTCHLARYLTTLTRARSQARFLELRGDFGCNESFFQQILPKYEYIRAGQEASDVCGIDEPNVTFTVSGIETTAPLGCSSALGIFVGGCTAYPQTCPSNSTNDDDEESEVMKVMRLKSLYGCSAEAGDILADYNPTTIDFGGFPVTFPANVSQDHVTNCLSEKYMCTKSDCEGVPSFLALSGFAYPLCSNETAVQSSQLSAFMAANGAGAGSKAIQCINEAATFCSQVRSPLPALPSAMLCYVQMLLPACHEYPLTRPL